MLTFAHFTTRAYPTLHRQAEHLLRRETAAGCAARDLLHDAYLRLAPTAPSLNDDAHGYRLYARTLRRVLADRARHMQSVRHGGQWQRVPLTATKHVSRSEESPAERLVAETLGALARVHAGQAQVLRLCQLEGYSQAEAAEALAVSVRTVKRWTRAGRATCAAYLRAEHLA
ncbi:MAG: sigma-70 family RNA polymerase sigma factor [Bacteroidota bacterium]